MLTNFSIIQIDSCKFTY